jgi:hypothetical protein
MNPKILGKTKKPTNINPYPNANLQNVLSISRPRVVYDIKKTTI